MYQFRPFKNTDPPAIVEIWSRQPPKRCLMQPMTTTIFETMVLAKPYFDPAGLIIASRDGKPVGFVHAGFGPNEDEWGIDHSLGVISLLLVTPEEMSGPLPAELLAQGEAYLRSRGAKVLYAGGVRPLDPFYLGLYGGSELPGVPHSDCDRIDLYKANKYECIDEVLVMHCDLASFRSPMNRQQIMLRRQCRVEASLDPQARSWWEACTEAAADRTCFALVKDSDAKPSAAAMFASIEPLCRSWGVRTTGLIRLNVEADRRRQGMATFLLAEAFRRLQLEGTSQIEAQTMIANEPARKLYEKLGFRIVERGSVLRKAS